MISDVFINRPRLAAVISIVLTLAGIIAGGALPIAQYPDIVPPQVTVTATYPGAGADVVETTVAQPIESRFLFVDVSAMRAKQLRKGAKVRLDDDHPRAIKPERVAMDEVRHKLVEWQLPDFNAVIDPK